MTCLKCQHGNAVKAGTTKNKTPRFRCKACGAKFIEPKAKPLGRHYTSLEDAERVLALLVEGVSIRAITRLTGLNKGTILSLLLTFGAKCATLFDERVQGIKASSIQADELWTFVQKKQKRLKHDDPAERGDQYVWVALDTDSKLVVTYHVGKRQREQTGIFIEDLRRRLVGAPQITTDGWEAYPAAIDYSFARDVHYATLIKQYAPANTDGPDWFRPSSRVTGVVKLPLIGRPAEDRICTSHVERANLTFRMHTRRLTRLTNGFSKKLVNLQAAIAIFMAYYNFCRVHQTLRVTPAMEAGLTDRVWTLADLLTMETARKAA